MRASISIRGCVRWWVARWVGPSETHSSNARELRIMVNFDDKIHRKGQIHQQGLITYIDDDTNTNYNANTTQHKHNDKTH